MQKLPDWVDESELFKTRKEAEKELPIQIIKDAEENIKSELIDIENKQKRIEELKENLKNYKTNIK